MILLSGIYDCKEYLLDVILIECNFYINWGFKKDVIEIWKVSDENTDFHYIMVELTSLL